MRSMIFAATAALILCAPVIASAGKFGGFSSDGTRYLDGDARVCNPLSASAEGAAVGAPQCTVVTNKKELAAYAFRKPKAGDTTPDGRVRLVASASGKLLRVDGTTSDGGVVKVVTWEAPTEIASTSALHLGDKGLIAVEYAASSLRGTSPSVIAFDANAALARLAPAPVEKPKDTPVAKPEKPVKGSSYDRAMAKGGVWEQPLVACDTARVTLTLKKNMKYTIRIETRCQGDKDVSTFGGKWVAEGAYGVVLQLDNDEDGTESILCTLGADEDEPTIDCDAGEDVQFKMKPVKR